MSRPNDQQAVHAASQDFAGTCGESRIACANQFLPAFIDRDTGRIELSRLASGKPAPIHLVAHLPQAWATICDAQGQVLELKANIEAGFVRDHRYYTREEAAQTQEKTEERPQQRTHTD
ncbi:MAG: hypothetical protein AAF529_19600 [Pseudomonadota bacterium]